MDVELDRDAERIVSDWIAALNAALESGAVERVGALFRPDADWRDVVALTRTIETVSDRADVARRLVDAAAGSGASGFAIDSERCPPRDVERAGEACVEAILAFETAIGTGAGHRAHEAQRLPRRGDPGVDVADVARVAARS